MLSRLRGAVLSAEFVGLIPLPSPLWAIAAEHATPRLRLPSRTQDGPRYMELPSDLSMRSLPHSSSPARHYRSWACKRSDVAQLDIFQVAVLFVSKCFSSTTLHRRRPKPLVGRDASICLYCIIAVCSYCKSLLSILIRRCCG